MTMIHPKAIHPTAIIDPSASLGADVEVGPYSIIEANCHVGDGTYIDAHVVLKEFTTVGKDCRISPGAVLGGHPQDLKFKNITSYVEIGDRVIIREAVTVNRPTGEGKITKVGDGSMLMAYSHLGHDCTLGQEVILANGVQLGGHVEVGDFAFLAGLVAIHQFVRIGRLAIISGGIVARQDIPPFAMADKQPAGIIGINKIGLKRRGIDLAGRTRIKRAYQLLWYSGLSKKEAIETIQQEMGSDPNIQELVRFVETSQRGIRRPHVKESARTDDKELAECL